MNRILHPFALLGAHALLALGALAQDEISFLRIRVENGAAQALEHSVQTGRLKPQGGGGGPLLFELIDGAGAVIHAGRAGDDERIEFPDGGAIGWTSIESPVREFIVRAPFFGQAKSIRFNREMIAGLPAPSRRLRALGAAESKMLTLVTNGPAANRLNWVVLAEGFQTNEEALFTNQAAAVLKKFLSAAPYGSYSNYFNGYAIFVPSNQSGADHPAQDIFRDTYFSTSYGTAGIDRLLALPADFALGRGRVNALLEKHLPEYDIVVMLVNDTAYGGSGGVPAIASLHPDSSEIVIHEVGHSFAGLGDEYETPANFPNFEEPNTTQETRRGFIKWRDWILASTPVPTPETAAFGSLVGLFEGAHYNAKGWYRPKLDCGMRTLGARFCEVCSEALILACYQRINLLESIEPPSPDLASTAQEPARISFRAIEGAGPQIRFDWLINGKILPDFQSPALDLAAIYASPGVHQVSLTAADRTAAVRRDPRGNLAETVNWTLTVLSTLEPVVTAAASQRDPDQASFAFDSSLLATLILESSADLQQWIPVRTNLAGRQIELTADHGATPREFLRVRALPVF